MSLKPGVICWGTDESTDEPEHVTILAKCHVNRRVWDVNAGSDGVHFPFGVDFMTSEPFLHPQSVLTSPDCFPFTLSLPRSQCKSPLLQTAAFVASWAQKREVSRLYFIVRWWSTSSCSLVVQREMFESRQHASTQLVDSSLPFSAPCWVAVCTRACADPHVCSATMRLSLDLT